MDLELINSAKLTGWWAACVHLPRAGITDGRCHIWLFYMSAGPLNSASYRQSQVTGSLFFVLFFETGLLCLPLSLLRNQE